MRHFGILPPAIATAAVIRSAAFAAAVLLGFAATASAGPIHEFGGTGSNSVVVQASSGANVPGWISNPASAPYLIANEAALLQQLGAGSGSYGNISFNGLHFYAGMNTPLGRTDSTIGGDGTSPNGFLTEHPPAGPTGPFFVSLDFSKGLSATSAVASTFFQFQGLISLAPSPVIGDNDYTLHINHDDGFSLKFWKAGSDPNNPSSLTFGVSRPGAFGPDACADLSQFEAPACYDDIGIVMPAGATSGDYLFALSLGSGSQLPTRLDATLVPEPSALALLSVGLLAFAALLRVRSHGSSQVA